MTTQRAFWASCDGEAQFRTQPFDPPRYEVGKAYSIPPNLDLSQCAMGLHASDRPSTAYRWNEKATHIDVVVLSGDMLVGPPGSLQKWCARNRKHILRVEIAPIVRQMKEWGDKQLKEHLLSTDDVYCGKCKQKNCDFVTKFWPWINGVAVTIADKLQPTFNAAEKWVREFERKADAKFNELAYAAIEAEEAKLAAPEIKAPLRLAYWANKDGQASVGDNLYFVGSTYTTAGDLQLCANGLHASDNPFDAVYHVPLATHLDLVLLSGEQQEGYSEDDRQKRCARTRTHLARIDLATIKSALLNHATFGTNETNKHCKECAASGTCTVDRVVRNEHRCCANDEEHKALDAYVNGLFAEAFEKALAERSKV